jgi:uncharacterized protein YegL
MAGRETEVIGGVNTFLDEQKALPDPASIAFVRFDTGAIERFRPMQPLADVQHLTSADFVPRGGTPLLDAVGVTVATLDDDWRREQPERCVVVIVTDGEENSSVEYTKEKVKALIQSRQDSGKWAFIYLGANVDSFAEAGSMGIARANTANYRNTAKGVKAAYSTLSGSVAKMRATGATVADNLGGDIKEDGSLAKKKTGAHAGSPIAPKAWTIPIPTAAWTPPQ